MDIPNRFDHAEACPRIYAAWENAGCFNADVNPDKPPFAIVIPPPNVTGALHLGHGLNNTLQDSLVRMKRMQGYEALWMPGTDHAGIATQAVVEKRLKENENKTRHDLGREALVQRIWAWKDQYEARILGQLKRMGCSCDWRRTRFTLDDQCAAAVRATFFDLFAKKLIYRGKRLVNWDTYLQTAVSDDEVFTETTAGHFWHFRYPVIDPQEGEPEFVEVATTRPETMLGDTAVAVHPDPASALDKIEEEILEKLAQATDKEREEFERQLETLRERRASHLPVLEKLRDMALAGKRLRLPLLGREIRLVADSWAKPELGSGCVKITPAHDPNDYEVGLRCELEMINILNPDGTLNEVAGPFAGLTIRKAREAVVAAMEEAGCLGEVEERDIELPYSDRSKTPIEPYLADQWFVRMDELAQSAMDAVTDQRVSIYPVRYRRGYLDWLSEKRDWPVSRQLWWGHRIPIWTVSCDAAGQQTLQEQLQAIEKSHPGNLAIQVEEGIFQVCIRGEHAELEGQIEALGFTQDPDVLDTWFSSALWPHSTLGWPEKTKELEYFYPTSSLITSRDIITLWVARMVLMGLNNMGEVPFREVFIHPKILDAFGETMSKSKGNGIDPVEIIDKFGPDALRFGLAWLVTADTQDVRLTVQFECPGCGKLIEQTKKNRTLPRIECSDCGKAFSTQWAENPEDTSLPRGAVVSNSFESARNFVNKLWNAARFAMLHLEDYQPVDLEPSELPLEDRWLLSRLNATIGQVTAAMESYQYGEVARVLYNFAWDDFCSFYVEIAKPRLSDPEQRAQTQTVLAYSLDTLLRLLHPVMPFVTEEIWQLLAQFAPERGLVAATAQESMILHASWPSSDPALVNAEIEHQFSLFQGVLGAVREIRSRQNIPPKESIPFVVRCSSDVEQLLRPMHAYFESMASACGNQWGPEVQEPETSAHVALPALGVDVFVDLEKFIDVEAELERNSKLLERLVKQIAGKEQKLQNESFVSRAPEDIVAREREGLEELKKQQQTVEQAIAALKAKQTS